ncbi:Prefoldin [Metschnikowia bicuspidata var. bicuspidata NRRL YB-4993]|uniref:Prefoldin n=1 Tax=Metschnikowia bicuspidata var. bicuspidata NRRL YB-4993 TaxID=869754 RepID=A0A1A0H7M7_9ASCO|nr:Prefoldin [Metschnikowia bicuspidata var. bicuspidata NRRL YB-4993]OBA19985.1 Prefoldin [Metschnikowia bicuspidata var. bicuspidata NRRL YB-4993]
MSEKQQQQEQKVKEHQLQYNRFQELLTDLQGQLSSIASQIQEHSIVDKTLTEIPPNKREGRKCYKMVGGVLVNKSVDEVIKILDEESKELTKSKELLEKEFTSCKKEMNDWMTKNKVKIVRQ